MFECPQVDVSVHLLAEGQVLAGGNNRKTDRLLLLLVTRSLFFLSVLFVSGLLRPQWMDGKTEELLEEE